MLLHMDYLNWENWGLGLPKRRRRPGKKKVKILAGGKILEVGEDQGDVWRQMQGDMQESWPIMPETGNWEQLHSTKPT